MWLTIIIFLAVLSVLVFAHELGHFWTARRFGVKAEEFGFGFPPRAVGVYKDSEGKKKIVRGNKEVKDASDTVFSLNWIPLGGFVKIKGEDGESENDPDSFAAQSVGKRAVIISAGVIMNIILAAVLFSVGFMIGMPQALEGVSASANVKNAQIQIMEVSPNSPAEAAGLEMGDVILDINGQSFASIEELQNFTSASIGEELNYHIKRTDEELSLAVTPEKMENIPSGGVGIAITSTGTVTYPWYLAIWEGCKTAITLLIAIIVAFYELIKNLIVGNGLSADLGGPVYIAKITGDAARMGFVYLLNFTALLSINLAVINFLPFPALDGGRFLFLVIEKIKGSPVKRELEGAMHYIGFILLMILVLVVTFRDIAKIF